MPSEDQPCVSLQSKALSLDANKLIFPNVSKGRIIACQENILYALAELGIELGYDEFAREARVFGVPHQKYLNDEAIDEIFTALDYFGLRPSADYLRRVLKTLARSNRAHPVCQAYEKLQAEWDGSSRLDSWLTGYSQIEFNPYTSEVGALGLMGMIRRVRVPGDKFDYVPILEGEGGIRKSTLISRLALDERWYTANVVIGMSTKELMEVTRNKTVAELEELAENIRAHPEAWKAFMSRGTDAARMAYGHDTTELDRQFVFWGSTNKAQYVRDETTGDRRLCPLACKGRIDIEGFMSVRGQLFGEAAAREEQWRMEGRPLVLTAEAEKLQRIELNQRFERTEQQAEIESALEGLMGFVPNDELYGLLGFARERRSPRETRPVTQIMTKLGWKQHTMRVGEDNSWKVRGWLLGTDDSKVLGFDCRSRAFICLTKAEYNPRKTSA